MNQTSMEAGVCDRSIARLHRRATMAQKIRVGANIVANSAIIISESLKTPREDSIVRLDTGETQILTPGRPDLVGMAIRRKKTTDASLSSTYKITLLILVGFTIISLLVEIGLAVLAKEPPTGFQRSLFDAADFGWKAGVGAFIGLLAGKQT